MALRKKIVKLAKMIGGLTGMINVIDENAPEYYSLVNVVDDDMADVALVMGLRMPKTLEEIAKRAKLPLDETKERLDKLADIGVVKVFDRDGETLYLIEVYAPGILEYMVNNRTLMDSHPEIGRAFEEYTRTRIAPLAPILPVGKGLVRVLPIEKAIMGTGQRVASHEEVSYYLEKNDKFAVTDCSCRKTRRLMGEGCGHLEKDMCMMLGETADYYIRTGKAREINREEAYELMKMAEDNGLVHEIPNIDGMDNTPAICNCCSCSCFAMRVATMMNAPDVIRSNFVSKVDETKCVACGQCVETCPTNALQLGQKLCSTTPIKVEETPTPRDRGWGEKYYNLDYRTNRKNVVETGTAPCKTECPAHIAVQGYIKLASLGKYNEALDLIKKENPFPAICGRICPHACENACTRGNIDDPIAIDEIKKFIADKDLNAETRFVPRIMHQYGKKIAIIGSGPAGLSCAYYLAIDGYKVTVFEKELVLGGMMTLGIPSFRLEKEVINAEIDILREMNVEFKTGVEVGKDVTIKTLKEQGYEGFYLAIGAQGGRKIGVEGEDSTGVMAGVDYLKAVALNKADKLSGNVVVIGGGNVAIDVARTAIRNGASNVSMYALEQREEMPALAEEIQEALDEGIEIYNGYGVKSLTVENGAIKAVELKKCITVFDENGKFNPTYDDNSVITVDVNYLLLSVGQTIEWGDLLKDTSVKLNKNNTVVADDFTFQTDEWKIITGGDCFTGPSFAINAIAAGKQGAISLHRAVQEGQSLVMGRDRREYKSLDKETAIIEGYDNIPRQRPLHNKKNEKTYKDTRITFTEDQMKKETERCLGCGAVKVNEEMCLGCGVCTTKCKFDAITLFKKYDKGGVKFESLPLTVAPYVVKRTAKMTAGGIKRIFKK